MKSARALFQLGAELVMEHQRATTGQVRVIPIVVDSLDEARPVFEALCEVMEGGFLDTSKPEVNGLDRPVPGTQDLARREATTTALASLDGRNLLVTSLSGDLIDADLEPPIGGDPTPGERALMAIARAANHRDLDQYEFAVVAYRTAPIDITTQRAVWKLFSQHFSGMPHARLKTLVVVAEATISIQLHCDTEYGFAFAIERGRMLRRHKRDGLVTAVRSIRERTEPLILFLGAGFAASSRLPMGDTIRDDAIRHLLGISDGEGGSSDAIARRFHRWLETTNRLTDAERLTSQDRFVASLTLERVIRSESEIFPSLPTLRNFRGIHDQRVGAPGPAVVQLAKILQSGHGRVVVVEVNFDLLIETHANTDLRVFATDEEFVDASSYIGSYLEGSEHAIPLIKLHGTISALSSCVVSESQTEQGIGDDRLEALRSLLPPRGAPARMCVYVGASLRDRDLLPALRGEEFARGFDERWVLPFLPESVEEFAEQRSPIWAQSGHPPMDHRLISVDADSFFSSLADVW